MTRNRKKTINYTNRNAFIRTRREAAIGTLRTETVGRDSGSTNFSVQTDTTNDSTSLYIDSSNVALRLTGSEARTLYRLLSKHYTFTGKTV